MSARRCRRNTCRLSWLVNKMSFSADVRGYKGCPMFSSIISHHPSLYPQLKCFFLNDSSSEWNRSWLLDFTFNAISSGYTVWRYPCSIMLIYSFVLIRQHDHQRPNKRMLVQSYSLYLSQQRWSLKGIKLMIMQQVLFLRYVLTCKLPDSGHLILMSESCLVPPIQPFPFTRTYLQAYNFVKKFLVNTIYYNKMHHYRNDKYTLQIIHAKCVSYLPFSVHVLVLCHTCIIAESQ